MPLFSVITPVYNKEKYLPLAIDSILKQSYTDFEYIIIDDGSTDSSGIIADQFAERDCRIRVIHQKNQWIYASFNNGIKAAIGEYVYILNADDRLRDGALGKLAQIVNKYNPDVIWTKILSHKADINQNILEYDYAHLDEKVLEDRFQTSNIEVREQWEFISKSLLNLNQANLYRRELMLKYPFRNDVYGADTLFNVMIANDIQSSYILSDPIYDFFEYQDFGNASTGKYYEYEHRMFNELFLEQNKLVKSWNFENSDYHHYILKKRLINFSTELEHYLFCQTMSTEEMIDKILQDMNDEIMTEVVNMLGAHSELERRCLFGISQIIKTLGLDKDSRYYYIKELIDCLEAQRNLFINVSEAVNNEKNSYRIGNHFFNSIKGGNVYEYLKYYFKF